MPCSQSIQDPYRQDREAGERNMNHESQEAVLEEALEAVGSAVNAVEAWMNAVRKKNLLEDAALLTQSRTAVEQKEELCHFR